MRRILVVYATRHGSTREVAEAVATVATAAGARVSVEPAASSAEPVGEYDHVVLGAPIYSGRWHRAAHRALSRWPWLVPVAVALFGGADPPGRNRPVRRDLRDWAAIGAWTRKVLAVTGPEF